MVGERLVRFFARGAPPLSPDARRGRKEVFWIAASISMPYVSALVQTLRSGVDLEPLPVMSSFLVNVAVVGALARGRSWARTLFVVLLTPLSIAYGAVPFFESVSAGTAFVLFLNAGIYGAAALVLARSPRVRAYIESQQEARVAFPAGSARRVLPESER